MKVLFDIVHPAHVHFFKHMIWDLEESGHQTCIVAREKDVTTNLLDAYGFDYVSVGAAGNKSRLSQLGELLNRVKALVRISRNFKPDMILTRNPAGVQAARLLGVTGVFDTDDGRTAGVHFRAAAPFAHVITTPDCFEEDYGRKHVKYPGYKQSAYLHSELFQPNPSVLQHLGVKEDERYYLVRFVSMTASHDSGEAGMTLETKRRIIEILRSEGRVFLSCEGDIPEEWLSLNFNVPSEMMHDALHYASLLVGDSQTMAAEAAVLGIPNIRVSTFVNRISYLDELEKKYRLTRAFHPSQDRDILDCLENYLENLDDKKAGYRARRRALENDKRNIAEWFLDRIQNDGFAS